MAVYIKNGLVAGLESRRFSKVRRVRARRSRAPKKPSPAHGRGQECARAGFSLPLWNSICLLCREQR
jgi:hypothetical protein